MTSSFTFRHPDTIKLVEAIDQIKRQIPIDAMDTDHRAAIMQLADWLDRDVNSIAAKRIRISVTA